MATELELRKRIRSVKNIAKVTGALSAVSASRARRAERQVIATRDYAGKAFEILNNLAALEGANTHPLLETRTDPKATLLIVFTGDRGLAGPYNTNIIKLVETFVNALPTPVKIVAVGRKGRDLLIRRGYDIVAEFTNMPGPPKLSVIDILPIAQIAIGDFLSGAVDQVFVAYTDFINLASSRPVIKQLFPFELLNLEGMPGAEYVKQVDTGAASQQAYTYEPAPEELLSTVIPRFTELQIYQSLLESIASEESSRYLAMQNATDNATALVDTLTLERNKVRQSNITSEILDIVGGAQALAQGR
jgi:F-type H+-transporting ATPase subunit gamma